MYSHKCNRGNILRSSDQVRSEALASPETIVFQYFTSDTKVSLPIFWT